MENNFYVGVVYHKTGLIRTEGSEKLVLYSENKCTYLDLIRGIWYTTDSSENDYVDSSSVIPTDISLYKIDFLYLLNKYKEKNNASKRRKYIC